MWLVDANLFYRQNLIEESRESSVVYGGLKHLRSAVRQDGGLDPFLFETPKHFGDLWEYVEPSISLQQPFTDTLGFESERLQRIF